VSVAGDILVIVFVSSVEAVLKVASDHLIFKCGFSKRIWKELMKLCHVENPVAD
jgi:hypothetical protein